ncbi:hypothetical protein [Microbacterium lushaniae]|nr:hypothetical protein [Microbacterium lushaniae]
MTDLAPGRQHTARVREVTSSDVDLPPTEPLDVTALIAAATASGAPSPR